MARFKLTWNLNMSLGDGMEKGDVIFIDAPHETHINTEMMRKAVKEYLNKNFRGGFSRSDWKIEKVF